MDDQLLTHHSMIAASSTSSHFLQLKFMKIICMGRFISIRKLIHTRSVRILVTLFLSLFTLHLFHYQEAENVKDVLKGVILVIPNK